MRRQCCQLLNLLLFPAILNIFYLRLPSIVDEGTGRGFELKFKQKINRTFSDFELIEPLRWSKDDVLEAFIDELLLLNVEDDFKQTPYNKSKVCQITERSQEEILSSLSQFYGLMTLAHYRTSPLDLRRLFDANSQCFFYR